MLTCFYFGAEKESYLVLPTVNLKELQKYLVLFFNHFCVKYDF